MSVRMSKARVIRAKAEPLTFAQVATVAPAVFAKEPGITTLPGYEFIDTEMVVRTLMGMDYVVTEASQQRAENAQMDMGAKHMVRMRHIKNFNPEKKVGEVVPEIVIVNAHNASSKLHMYLGLWRFLCSNGLMVGETFDSQSFFHRRVDTATIQAAVNHAGNVQLPKVQEQVKLMQKKDIAVERQRIFATNAIALRWPEGTEAANADRILLPRRATDAGDSVWRVYNRVQENLLQGGFTALNRNLSVRPMEQVTNVIHINRALWDMALKLAA
jgi:Domain of unknown function (DUF932)